MWVNLISFIPRVIKILEINLYNPRNNLLKLGGLVFIILAPNLNIFQRILSQPLIEDISIFPSLEIKSKIKIQKGKLIFVFAPQSENYLKIGAHLRKLKDWSSSHLRWVDLRWSAISSPTTSELLIDRALFAAPFFDYRSVFLCLFPEKLWKLHGRTIQTIFGILSLSIGRYFSSSPLV